MLAMTPEKVNPYLILVPIDISLPRRHTPSLLKHFEHYMYNNEQESCNLSDNHGLNFD